MATSVLTRPLQVVRNLVLVGRTAVQHASDEPMLLLVQTARRLPARTRSSLARILAVRAQPGVRLALAYFVADRPSNALEALDVAPRARTTASRRLAAELAVQLGHPEASTGGLAEASPLTKARAAWNRGDIDAAITYAESTGGSQRRYAARLISERTSMEPGVRLTVPRFRPLSAPGGQTRALHVLTNSVPHTASGYAFRSHQVLRSQVSAGIEVAAATRIGYPVTVGLLGARNTETVDGVPYHRLLTSRLAPLPGARLAQMVRALLPLVEQFQPTVLHTTTNYTNALVTQALAEATGLPWVYEVRGQLEKTWLADRPAAVRERAEGSERYRLLRAKETEMILAADHVVTLSETLAEDIRERGRAVADITVIPNGVDESLLGQDLTPAHARQQLGLPDEGYWVGSVSSLVGYEGFDTLLTAVARLRSDGKDVRVALVGDGVSRPALLAQASESGMARWVHLPGRVPHHQAPLWHQALDAFVVPRHDLPVTRIVTPLKPIEAMALGRPVIASDLPALTEIVTVPGSGTVFTPGQAASLADAIALLRANPERAIAYGVAGRTFARTRTWQAHGLTYRDVYGQVTR